MPGPGCKCHDSLGKDATARIIGKRIIVRFIQIKIDEVKKLHQNIDAKKSLVTKMVI